VEALLPRVKVKKITADRLSQIIAGQ
jgi:hypothetical protein